EDIASRAGAASGAFYLYFRSKRQLLLVLVDELMQSIESLELARDTNLRRFLGRALREDRRHYGVVRAFHEVCASDPELSALRERIERWTSRRILKFFEQLAKHPRTRRIPFPTRLPTRARSGRERHRALSLDMTPKRLALLLLVFALPLRAADTTEAAKAAAWLRSIPPLAPDDAHFGALGAINTAFVGAAALDVIHTKGPAAFYNDSAAL